MPPQALAAKWGLGAILGDGQQPMPWIHLDDLVGLIRHAMAEPVLHGPINAVAPQPVSQAEFAHALAAVHGMSVRLKMPSPVLHGILGEMSELLLCGQNALPVKALASGYRFRHPQVGAALTELAGKQ